MQEARTLMQVPGTLPPKLYPGCFTLMWHQRLKALGVVFTMPPTPMGPVSIAMLADTCGNLIQIYQVTGTVG